MMGALTTSTTFYPRSSQLKLALSVRKPPLAYARARFPVHARRSVNFVPLVVRSSAVNENSVESRRSGNSSWSNLSSSADDLAGWGNADDDRESGDSKPKQSIAGILVAGAAGIVFVAGLTFAALSLSKRSTSKVKEQLQPLTEVQEKSLSSDNDQNQIELEKNGGEVGMLMSSGEEGQTSTSQGPYLTKENGEAVESGISDDTGVGQSSEDGNDTLKGVSGSFVSPEATNETPISDVAAGSSSLMVGIVDSGNPDELKAENPVDTKMSEISLVKSENFVTMSGLNEGEKPKPPPGEVVDSSIIKEFGEVLSSRDVELTKESSTMDAIGQDKSVKVSIDEADKSLEGKVLNVTATDNGKHENDCEDINADQALYDSENPDILFTSAGIPAPSIVSAALLSPPGKVLVPAVVDQLQSQALSALQVLKVIEEDVQPGNLCTRREYARWLVLASSTLSRNATSKVYPAMYIENSSEIAFDDISPEDPDFPSIQGLAEAGLIASKLSRRDMQPFANEDSSPIYFSPESPLSRQDLVSWKMALEKRQLPVVDKKAVQQSSGFIDVDKIHPDAWPSLVADLSAGEQSIITLAFGYTRLFQPDKPVTNSQAAIALSTGEASAIVSEELARIEAESIAVKAVAAHNALVAQVEKDLNASYEEELSMEREKINAVEKMAEEARREVEKLRAAREEEKISLVKEHAAVDSEMELLSRLRQEAEEKLQTLMAEKLEISYEKERLNKLRKDAETENEEITRLHYELEVERKALSMARSWAEDEAKRAREQAKALDEVRERRKGQGINVVVDKDLREVAEDGTTWLEAGKQFSAEEDGKQFSVEETIERSETLVDKLRKMADEVRGKCKDTINIIIEKITLLISELKKKAAEWKDATKSGLNASFQNVQQRSSELNSTVKRVAGDWKEGVERLSQRFKT